MRRLVAWAKDNAVPLGFGLLALVCMAQAATTWDRQSDEAGFAFYADRLLDGDFASTDHATHFLWRGPGLPALMAIADTVGLPIEAQRLANALLVVLAAFVIYRTVGLLGSSRWIALGTAVAFGLYPTVLRTTGPVLSEPLAMVLMAVAVNRMVHSVRRDSSGQAVLAGLALGALAMVRLEYVYVLGGWLVVMVVWHAVRRTQRLSLIAAAVAALACVPWVIYASSQADRFPYVSNAGGLSLYWMASPVGDEMGNPFAYEVVDLRPQLAPHRPFFDEVRSKPIVEQDDLLREQAWEWIKDNPRVYAEHLVNNATRMIFNVPFSFTQQRAGVVFNVGMGFLLLVALGYALWRRPSFPGPFGPLLALALIGFLARMPVGSYTRYVAPLLPILFIYIGYQLRPRASAAPEPGA